MILEPNYHTSKQFSENVLVIEMKKRVLKNKPVYLGLSIIDINKKTIHEFWYDYIKPKYGEKQNDGTWIQIA